MRDIDLELEINDMLYINCSIDTTDLEDFLKEKLDLSEDETQDLINEIEDMVDDEGAALQESLMYMITEKLQKLIEAKNIKEHPEDAPWQTHLFEE